METSEEVVLPDHSAHTGRSLDQNHHIDGLGSIRLGLLFAKGATWSHGGAYKERTIPAHDACFGAVSLKRVWK